VDPLQGVIKSHHLTAPSTQAHANPRSGDTIHACPLLRVNFQRAKLNGSFTSRGSETTSRESETRGRDNQRLGNVFFSTVGSSGYSSRDRVFTSRESETTSRESDTRGRDNQRIGKVCFFNRGVFGILLAGLGLYFSGIGDDFSGIGDERTW